MSRRIGIALAVAGATLLVYRLDAHYVRTGDTFPAELLPVSILREGDLDFNEIRENIRGGYEPEQFYSFTRVGDRVLSHYPIVPGLLNLPAHAVAQAMGWDTLEQSAHLARWTSSVVAALSVFFLTLTLLAVCQRTGTAVLMGGLYAFGTTAWSVAATGLWQQGPSLLFISAAFAGLCSRRKEWLFAAGFMLGMAVWNRPPNAVVALAAAAYVAFHRREQLVWFLGGALAPALALAAYSVTHWGSLWALGQGQRLGGQHGLHTLHFTGPLLPNLAGTLASPNRGLFVFTPVFLLALPMLWRVLSRPRERPLFTFLSLAALAHLLVHSLWSVWWGGASFGYRLLTEMVPLLILLLALSWEHWLSRRRVWIGAFAALGAVSVYFHFLGALYYPSGWNERPVNVDRQPSRVWDASDTELRRLQARFLEQPPWAGPGRGAGAASD